MKTYVLIIGLLMIASSCSKEDPPIKNHEVENEKKLSQTTGWESAKELMDAVQPDLYDYFMENEDIGEIVQGEGTAMADEDCWAVACCYQSDNTCFTATKTDDGWDWDVHNGLYEDLVADGHYDPSMADEYPDLLVNGYETAEVIQGISETDDNGNLIDFTPAP